MRQCGDCQLCCKLLPVKELKKGASERCRHQRVGVGCTVYNRPAMPPSCKLWNCRWLVDPETAGLSRPDRSHYVVDIMPDFIRITYDDQDPIDLPAVQVWVDPGYPDAHLDTTLRAYLERQGEQGLVAIIRYSESDGFVLFPPAFTPDGTFREHRTAATTLKQDLAHTLALINAGAKS